MTNETRTNLKTITNMEYSLSGALNHCTPFQLAIAIGAIVMFLITFFLLILYSERKNRQDLAAAERVIEHLIEHPGYDIQDDILRDEFHS